MPYAMRYGRWGVCPEPPGPDFNSMQDFAKPDSDTKVPRGHGTSVAIVCAGAQSGVASNANLYLIKHGAAVWGGPDDQNRHVTGTFVLPKAVLHSLVHIVRELDAGRLPKGKVVVYLGTGKSHVQRLEMIECENVC